ncbi:MAG: cation diffusion facilitator family transporter [Actinomycetes bacterium]
MSGTSSPGSASESTGTVLLALAANAGIGVAKGVAALVTGSAAMAAETAHSVADTVNEILLLAALRRSQRPADRLHPLGYGQERFFWSLVAAVSIFVSGAVFSAVEGIRAMLGGESAVESPGVAYAVLAVSFVLEGTSLLRAVKQVRSEAAHHRQTVLRWLRTTDDPPVKTVFYEDSAALVGLLLAAGGIAVHELTGSPVADGVASLLIATLLTWVAYRLAATNKNLLVPSQADPRLVHAIAAWLRAQPSVDALVDLLTIRLGTDQVLVCARLDFRGGLASAEIEDAALEMDSGMRTEFPDVFEVFLEPVPRHDAELRERVRRRYGPQIAALIEAVDVEASKRGGRAGRGGDQNGRRQTPPVRSQRVRTPEDPT